MNCFDSTQPLSGSCFETILQTMAEAVFIVDATGVIRYCNRAMEELTGKPRHQLIGKSCREIMLCACGPDEVCGLFRNGQIDNIECRVRRPDGSYVHVLKNGRTMPGPDGVVNGAVETLTDITPLKTTQQRLARLEESIRSRGRYSNLIGKSHAMAEVFDLIDLACASSATVLITGESGTGKELVARAIHDKSPRASGPLVKVNCSALPESLLESELFGHTRGAFTGAVRDKIGRFEAADGGTLFLDEIGEISPFIQVKLLRFLQEREFERVGESTTRGSDVRIIAATNRDLRALISTGGFREDLYYRLKVFPVHLPPLRERKEDVGPLVEYFIEKFNRETGKHLSGLSPEAALTMMDYCWPGNIRELENAIEHAFVTCRGGEIGVFDLPLEIRKVEIRAGICIRGEQPTGAPQSIGEMTHDTLLSVLQKFRGNRSEAARYLGVDRTTLWRNMKRLGMSEKKLPPQGNKT